jgi:hypothetical protein
MPRPTLQRALALFAVVGGVAAACGTLDTQDKVHDLRILGMRADPPEQLEGVQVSHFRDAGAAPSDAGLDAGFDGGGLDAGPGPTDAGPGTGPSDAGHPGFPFDGGFAGLFDGGLDLCLLIAEYDAGGLLPPGFDAGCSALIPLQPFRITALVADPLGNGRALHYRWDTCILVDSTARCGTDALGYQNLDQGDFTPTGISSELSTTFLPSGATLALARSAGVPSVQLPVQLTVSAGSETDVGIKTITVTAFNRALPIAANANPILAGLQAGGVDWSLASPPIFTSTAAAGTSTGGGGLGGPGGKGSGSAAGIAVEAILDAGAETYVAYLADGTSTERQERIGYDFFATMGTFSPPTAGRAGTVLIPDGGGVDAGPVDAGPDAGPQDESHWAADSSAANQTVTFWVVVYDGRGGVSWVERTAQYSR